LTKIILIMVWPKNIGPVPQDVSHSFNISINQNLPKRRLEVETPNLLLVKTSFSPD